MANNAWKHEKRRIAEAARAEREQREANERSVRWHNLWNVPERARDQYIEMADVVGEDAAEKILAFFEAMQEPEPGGD